MATPVEHEKRKHEILARSLDLFVEEGYEDVTFQKIADRCGITRTTLYIYFKNKREIFTWSIKQLLSAMEQKLVGVLRDKSLSSAECLNKVIDIIVTDCESNARLFKVLLSYLMQLQKSGGDVENRINHRIVKLQHFINMVLIQGQQTGEFKQVPIKTVNQLLYSLIEDGVFHLAMTGKADMDECRSSCHFVIAGLRQ